ncbi:MAG TPA: nicotinate-nucleotide adenylyltransferase [Acidobacteriota bacterium]|nr:nicotinate-nucleotide adenylyltransferase [Acidobacteriota bacterium]
MGPARVGVFGGTFNPIHSGHLHIAAKIQSVFSLSRIYFVVASSPPHKRPEDLVPFLHRYAMVSLAVSGNASFIPSLVELEPEASAYSIDTLKKLSRQAERDEGVLFFIAGGDSLLDVKTWHESEKLLTAYNFIFVIRPGIAGIDASACIPGKAQVRMCDVRGLAGSRIKKLIDANVNRNTIYLLDAGAPAISSSMIRDRVASGKTVRRMVPEPVHEYMEKLNLYGGI